MIAPSLLPPIRTTDGEDLRGAVVSLSVFFSFLPLWSISREFDLIGLDLDFFLDINEAEILSGRYWAMTSTAGVPLYVLNSRSVLPDEIYINQRKFYKVATSLYDFSPSLYISIPMVKEVFIDRKFLYNPASSSKGEWSESPLTRSSISSVFSEAYGTSVSLEEVLEDSLFPTFFNIREGDRFMSLQFSPYNVVSPVWAFTKIALLPKPKQFGDFSYWVDMAREYIWKGIDPRQGIVLSSSTIEDDRPSSNEGIAQIHEITYNDRKMYVLSGTQHKLNLYPHLIVVDDLYLVPLVWSIRYIGESTMPLTEEDVYNFFVAISVNIRDVVQP